MGWGGAPDPLGHAPLPAARYPTGIPPHREQRLLRIRAHSVPRHLCSSSNLTDGVQGTGGDRGTQADTHGQSGRHRGLVGGWSGCPPNLHTARVRRGRGGRDVLKEH